MSNIEPQPWRDFIDSGMMWWVNRILHTFSWSIVYQENDDGEISAVFPARTQWLGFPPKTDEENFAKFQAHVGSANDPEIELSKPEPAVEEPKMPHELKMWRKSCGDWVEKNRDKLLRLLPSIIECDLQCASCVPPLLKQCRETNKSVVFASGPPGKKS